MFFKNKETGLVWEVVDEDHIKRCQNDPSYEEVKTEVEQPKKQSVSKVKSKASDKE
ncbi:hypothetical protein QFZ28_004370 [Neobacillus niacini]|uniref:hypothetical protein n=1 Tax=Neobacillus niacini TaxID=86668 RepID=UPI002784F27C|nr:hypothetical protein [Neobacillus niacini]MDQ1003970.1 hypothetical protein [Neobacillus niacini]